MFLSSLLFSLPLPVFIFFYLSPQLFSTPLPSLSSLFLLLSLPCISFRLLFHYPLFSSSFNLLSPPAVFISSSLNFNNFIPSTLVSLRLLTFPLSLSSTLLVFFLTLTTSHPLLFLSVSKLFLFLHLL